jgi:hypothetical protein
MPGGQQLSGLLVCDGAAGDANNQVVGVIVGSIEGEVLTHWPRLFSNSVNEGYLALMLAHPAAAFASKHSQFA